MYEAGKGSKLPWQQISKIVACHKIINMQQEEFTFEHEPVIAMLCFIQICSLVAVVVLTHPTILNAHKYQPLSFFKRAKYGQQL